MAVTDVFTALFAKRQAKQQTARQAYFELRANLAAGKKIVVDEIDVVLTTAGISPERLQQDLTDLAKLGELDARRAKCKAEGDKAPHFAAEVEQLKVQFEDMVQAMRHKIAQAEYNSVAAGAQAVQVNHIDGQMADIQQRLDRLPGDPEPIFDPFPNAQSEEDVSREQAARHAQLRAERAARPPQPSGRPRPATGPFIASETFDRVPS